MQTERCPINNLTLHLKELRKKANFKVTRKYKIRKIREETNKTTTTKKKSTN